ncbi:tetratricopeptide repeat protein [Escherichia fergusonii]|uniref:tetratricopeptide repeat protein n=1 Tax=Escherichia fergusonii TaxID=564 RepID=UPI0011CEAFA8|nr:tetratricopeptide repeat protein [Escherichia fergusonii]EFL4495594.1 tetratricopeptide repeat protein [Escherichia fergusonii]EGO8190042.1 hypothetical protein [Escherichia fergusonii]EHG6148251.1 tetratricopeptide repeat protein [Escherichia fergusonii]EHG6205963.1 tetratricopeptide repeat protein [Escherichia fergusonii]MBV7579733.1 tetratricopeptide repeat protein [Escherichia fergusonii]
MHYAVVVMLELLCCIHAYRTGQERYWFFIIFCFPVIGCVAYFVMVMLPETGADRHGRTLLMRLQDKISPERHLHKLTEELAIAETNQNHYALANELARLGRYHEAVPHYQQALSGIFAHEAVMMLSLAQAQFAIQEFAACQQTLEDVMRYNPDFQSADGHLLFARALAAQEKYADAESEFEVLVSYYPGPQARIYYAEMLEKMSRLREANEQYVAVVDTAKRSRPHYRKRHREWIKTANDRLKQSIVR